MDGRNLKTTRYNDGSEIPFIVDTADAWHDLNATGYCWYADNESNKESVDALYNWHALNTESFVRRAGTYQLIKTGQFYRTILAERMLPEER